MQGKYFIGLYADNFLGWLDWRFGFGWVDSASLRLQLGFLSQVSDCSGMKWAKGQKRPMGLIVGNLRSLSVILRSKSYVFESSLEFSRGACPNHTGS